MPHRPIELAGLERDPEHRARADDAVLAARESALRRIASLVAGGAASSKVFAAIVREVGRVVGLPLGAVWRYGADAGDDFSAQRPS